MPFFTNPVEKDNSMTVVELKRLLVDIYEKKPSIRVRYRLLGEMWARDFQAIAGITDSGVLLKSDIGNRITVIANLTDIMQFEIDEPFHSYRPYNHYLVKPATL